MDKVTEGLTKIRTWVDEATPYFKEDADPEPRPNVMAQLGYRLLVFFNGIDMGSKGDGWQTVSKILGELSVEHMALVVVALDHVAKQSFTLAQMFATQYKFAKERAKS